MRQFPQIVQPPPARTLLFSDRPEPDVSVLVAATPSRNYGTNGKPCKGDRE
jgi:hypothetical protein